MNGISIQVSDSLATGGNWRLTIAQPDSYSHSISALGGFNSAEMRLADQQLDLEDWLVNGLGRHVVVYNEAGAIVWEGFVDSLEGKLGSLTVTRGPLLQVVNRTALVYSTVDTTVTPPLAGGRAKTTTINHAVSQGLFGIIEALLSGGGMTPTDAAQAAATFLAENAYPATSQTVNLSSGGAPQLTISCRGYYAWLESFVYNYTAASGTVTATAKILAALAANPNIAWLPFGIAGIAANALTVARYEDGDNTAWNIIKSTTALGDATNARWLFGVYEGRACQYNAAPTVAEYQQRIATPRSQVLTIGGAPVDPWDVRPGKWLFLPDFLTGYAGSATLRTDPRYLFIESVQYSMPYGLTLQAGKTDTLGQQLAQLGIAGIGG